MFGNIYYITSIRDNSCVWGYCPSDHHVECNRRRICSDFNNDNAQSITNNSIVAYKLNYVRMNTCCGNNDGS